MGSLEGVYSVIPTPFTQDFEIDIDSLLRVIDLFIGVGVHGLTALGVTSETTRLNERERGVVLDSVMNRVNGRIPVVVGASAEGTRLCIEFTQAAQKAGAFAVMISPPRMNKLNSEAVVRHFKTVADAVDIPIVIQDYPPISGYTMEPSLLVRIAREVPAARAIKLEDPPTPYKTSRIVEQSEGLSIRIFGGLGGMYLFEELMAGATGAMTGFAYPEILLEVIRLFRAGDVQQSAAVFYQHVALMRFEFQEGIGMAIRKEMFRRRGAFSQATLRAPGIPLDSATSLALDTLLGWLKNEGSPWI
jgi:4-hydroxy-tetrahydrodipicolinate synthase